MQNAATIVLVRKCLKKQFYRSPKWFYPSSHFSRKKKHAFFPRILENWCQWASIMQIFTEPTIYSMPRAENFSNFFWIFFPKKCPEKNCFSSVKKFWKLFPHNIVHFFENFSSKKKCPLIRITSQTPFHAIDNLRTNLFSIWFIFCLDWIFFTVNGLWFPMGICLLYTKRK